MKKRIGWILPILIVGIIIYGCSSPKSKYENRLKNELESGVRNDSLFMGIYFGMGEKEFYSHCWKLNKEGLIKQGPQNTTVEHQLKDELKYPASMYFYPEFTEGKIYEMPIRFVYNGWTPWNKELSSESLQLDVLKWLEQTYGDGFMKVKHPERGMAYFKVDGNRRITIFKEDDTYVWAVFTDMLVNTDLKKKNSSPGN
ncbi:MAG: hypothetical protein ABFS16_03665 [Bacteroidota bacterium]